MVLIRALCPPFHSCICSSGSLLPSFPLSLFSFHSPCSPQLPLRTLPVSSSLSVLSEMESDSEVEESFRPRLYELFSAIEKEFEVLHAENQLCKNL